MGMGCGDVGSAGGGIHGYETGRDMRAGTPWGKALKVNEGCRGWWGREDECVPWGVVSRVGQRPRTVEELPGCGDPGTDCGRETGAI